MKRWHLIVIIVLILAATVISGCKPKTEKVGDFPAVEKMVPQSMEYLTLTARCEADASSVELICLLNGGDQTYVGNLIAGQAANGWELNTIAQGDVDIFVFQRPFSK